MGNDITVPESIQITAKDITNLFCPLATEKEVKMALGIVQSFGLNPFKREVHMVKYNANSPISIIVGYEVYLKRAERSGKLDGWSVGIDQAREVAWVKIKRKDWSEPFIWEVSLQEFNKKQSTWNSMPTFMAKKVAIAQGFRLCFSEDLAGMPYTQDEYNAYDMNGVASNNMKPAVTMPKALESPQEPPIKMNEEYAKAVEMEPLDGPRTQKDTIPESLLKKTETLAIKVFKKQPAFKEWLLYIYGVESLKELTKEQVEEAGAELFRMSKDKK